MTFSKTGSPTSILPTTGTFGVGNLRNNAVAQLNTLAIHHENNYTARPSTFRAHCHFLQHILRRTCCLGLSQLRLPLRQLALHRHTSSSAVNA